MSTNTLTPLQSSIIDANRGKIAELRHAKPILKYLSSQGCTVTAEQLYCYLNPDRTATCPGMWFVSYSVGYRVCQRGCACHKAGTSKRSIEAKSKHTEEQRRQITEKRRETVRERYGVDSVWQLAEVKQQSANTRREKYGTSTFNNRDKAAKTSLQRYGVDNPAKTPEVQSKMRATCLEKYGAPTPMSTESARQRIAETLMENYGVTHPSQSRQIRDRTLQTLLTRYGTDNAAKNAAVRAKMSESNRRQHYPEMLRAYQHAVIPGFTVDEYVQGIDTPWICVACDSKIFTRLYNGIVPRCTTCLPYSVSVFENEVRRFIASIYSGPVEYNRRDIIAPKELDIYIPEHNLAIECNGVYRHTTVTGGKAADYHLNKTLACQKVGIELIHINDSVWLKQGKIMQNMLKHRLGTSVCITLDQYCVSTTVERQKVCDFLNNNDLLGSNDYTYAVVLYYLDNIAAVMTATQASPGELTLDRITVDPDYAVAGAVGVLFSHLLRVSDADTVVAYTDDAYATDQTYGSLGFELVHATAPEPYRYQNYLLADAPDYTLAPTDDAYWGCGYSCWRYRKLPN